MTLAEDLQYLRESVAAAGEYEALERVAAALADLPMYRDCASFLAKLEAEGPTPSNRRRLTLLADWARLDEAGRRPPQRNGSL